MRLKRKRGGVTVNAIAGTRVVMFGFDLTEHRRKTCMGFAIQRVDHEADEQVWLRGLKTFEATDPGLGPVATVPSRDHPFQSFQWADYAAEPGRAYTYRVFGLRGTGPHDLTLGEPVVLEVTTEPEAGVPHSIYFNRGSVASQAYARDFFNTPPSAFEDPEDTRAAYKFLSRGLLEAMLAFIARADGARFELHGAVYEFEWPAVLEALGAAAATGANVSVIYDAIPGARKPKAQNEQAIADAGIGGLVVPRTRGSIMHNKFFVLSQDGVPIAVWTGSTNVTEQGIFGHLNVGHAIEDAGIAREYRDYWDEVARNLTQMPDRAAVAALAARPPDPLDRPITTLFSPQPTTAVLDWYAGLAGTDDPPLFMTFAFGMADAFARIYERPTADVLRMALMESEGTGRKAVVEAATRRINALRRRPNVIVAVGGKRAISGVEKWVDELRQIGPAHVFWIHTKFALIDPLGALPTVITGSANFSAASTDTNQENMLVIRGDTRVADIYLTEFMRLFSHYAFRETLLKREIWQLEAWHPGYLTPDVTWSDPYFRPGQRSLRRRYFAQT